jgi:hypothetical protein
MILRMRVMLRHVPLSPFRVASSPDNQSQTEQANCAEAGTKMTAFVIILIVIVLLVARSALRGNSSFTAGHVGKIGERLELPVTLVDAIAFEKWGRTRHRFRFSDSEGHCFVWWTDVDDAGIPAGARATAKMTVKEHTRYRGTDETVVQYVRVHTTQSK